MAQETFKISYKDENGKISLKEVKGERVTISNVECFVFNDKDDARDVNISHLETGAVVSRSFFLERAIEIAKRNFSNATDEFKVVRDLLTANAINLPVNK